MLLFSWKLQLPTRHFIKLAQPSFKLMLALLATRARAQIQTSRPAYRMTGLKAHVVHLYPRWVLFKGKGILICISRQPLSFCPISLAMIFIYYKDFKTLKITQFGALAGQIQHMAAQKVGFTRRQLGISALMAGNIWKTPPFWGSDSPLFYLAMWSSYVHWQHDHYENRNEAMLLYTQINKAEVRWASRGTASVEIRFWWDLKQRCLHSDKRNESEWPEPHIYAVNDRSLMNFLHRIPYIHQIYLIVASYRN